MTATPQREDVVRLAEASAWRVHLAEHDLETNDDFEAWLAADPRNMLAWDHVQADWLLLGEHANSPDLLRFRSDALRRARRSRPVLRTRGGWWLAVAACLLILISGGGVWWSRQPEIYRTALGERRVVTLADGSKASLDADTQLAVRFTGDTRKLELIKGQARFDVAHDLMRPFLVQAGDRTVIATGTAFNVDLLGGKTMVTLIEGRVVVVDRKLDMAPLVAFRSKPRAAVSLTPGQQLVISPGARQSVAQVNLDNATAWEGGTLVFSDEPMGLVAERIARYSDEPIVVAPGAAAMKISGVFKAGDVATFVDVVTHYLPVKAVESGGTTTIEPKN
ncbi:FecR family protein [Sphingomonas mali]|uniref:FecR family protein n=1 Tax=Sphingomonas mali TaxID=40682 RepID=UPI0008357B72|nr:FecR domain-containing protein [Sphingomonas mali]